MKPIVLVTGLARDQDKNKGLKAGASAYIVKGDFDEENLLNVIKLTGDSAKQCVSGVVLKDFGKLGGGISKSG